MSTKRVEAALRWSGGLVTAAAKRLNVSPSTVHKFMNEHPQLHALRDEINEALCDLAENTLYRAIREGDLRATMYFLDRRARHRGYGHKAELTGKDGAPVQLELEDTRAVLAERLNAIAGRFERAREKPDETKH